MAAGYLDSAKPASLLGATADCAGRVQRAKRLPSTTDLPMTGFALQAEFGSLRRFSAASAEA